MVGIVVGLDGSAGSTAALRWAIDDARLRGSDVRAVLAWAAPDRPDEVNVSAQSPLLEDLAVAARRLLHQTVRGVSAEAVSPEAGSPEVRAVRVVERAVYSTAAHALLQESLDADLLVVGTRTRQLRRYVIAGSVGDTCAHKASVPVVVVREPAEGQSLTARPVLVGVDGSAASLAALRWAAREADMRGVPLRVLYAQPRELAGRLVFPGPLPGRSRPTGTATLDYSATACRAQLDELRLTPELINGDAATALIHEARHAQLLVIGVRGTGGFPGLTLGSVAHACVVRSPCPVAVVGRGWSEQQPPPTRTVTDLTAGREQHP